jgi:hypothetical protein
MNQDGRWSNTYETSAILEVIAFYCKKHEADTSAYKLSLSANGKSYFSSSSEVDIRKPVSIHIPISDLNVGKNDICILKNNKNYLYYTIKYLYNCQNHPNLYTAGDLLLTGKYTIIMAVFLWLYTMKILQTLFNCPLEKYTE